MAEPSSVPGTSEARCRACHASVGELVLDLGVQPASDHFPRLDEPGPDPSYPLQMWLCAACGLAQLLDDPTVPEEPKATEPAALVEQARDAVERVGRAGWLRSGASAAEYGSPHGGSWLALLAERGLLPVPESTSATEPADVVLDCFGLMHFADQGAAIAERAARIAPGGVLLLQYHSLATIVAGGQWNSLRHGHYAYYSATALTQLFAAVGLVVRSAWSFELYGGTVLLAVTRAVDSSDGPDDSVRDLLAHEERIGVRNPDVLRGLQHDSSASAQHLHEWLMARREQGARVLGYGAASRAVALLCKASIDAQLLPAIADASPAKHGRRMPSTDIAVITPEQLIAAAPDDVVLMLPDLLAEVRKAMPEIEAGGARWVNVEDIGRMSDHERTSTA